LGSIQLSSACAINKDGNRECGIALVTAERTFFLVADDETSRNEWIKVIQAVIAIY
jgi:hypothetical protein